MPSSGPNSPSVALSVANSGATNWSSVNNIFASDNAYALGICDGTDGSTDFLRATGFGFAIPAGSIIDGIVVEVERSESNADDNIRDILVSLTKTGATYLGDNKADTVTEWPTVDAYKTYGGAADLWGASWSVAEINSANFGVFFAAKHSSGTTPTARVDHIRITVYYTVPTNKAATDGVAFTEVSSIAINSSDAVAFDEDRVGRLYTITSRVYSSERTRAIGSDRSTTETEL